MNRSENFASRTTEHEKTMTKILMMGMILSISSYVYGQSSSTSTPSESPESKGAKSSSATTVSTLRIEASESLRRGDRQAAVRAADALVANFGDEIQAMAAAGDVYLRSGQPEKSVTQFDRLIAIQPDQMPYLWQRGIALFLVKKYDAAAEQFAKHREVNPHDVENAAWHFACIAKSQTPGRAKEMLLPAPGDGREPMNEILSMLASGDTDQVRTRIGEVVKRAPGSRDAEDAKFYGELYLALYADAMGNIVEARNRIKAASTSAPHHYMGDVARVYADDLHRDER